MKIVIAGAGIAGLTAALSLHAAGFREISVYERVEALHPLGVGINLLPHAVRELTELGLGERLAGLGTAPRTLGYFNRYGSLIWSEPRGVAAGYRWPQLSVHRGELRRELLAAVGDRLGPDTVRLGHRLLGADPDGTARFATAHGTAEVAAELVVGADGIHSALRRQHHPGEGPPVWNGLTLWRGTARAPGFLDGRTMIMAGDAEQKFVAYPLLAHERAPAGFTDIHDVITADELAAIATGYKRAAGFHPEELNSRPSLTPPDVRERL